MSDLPEGWALGSLNDLIATGGLFSDGDWIESKDQDPQGENRLLQLADIGDGVFINKSSRFVNNDKFHLLNCTELEEGDLLIARMPDPLGRACLMPNLNQRCLTVVDVALFRSGSPDISHKCLMHFINSPIVRKSIELESSGTTRKRIARGKLSEIKLPIPPVSEQRRIAQKLEELLAKVNVLTLRVNAIPALLKRFRQSVLAAAVAGRLTEEWRAENLTCSLRAQISSLITDKNTSSYGNSIPVTWALKNAGDICEFITKGTTPSKEKMSAGLGEVPFIKVYNLTFTGALDFSIDPTFVDVNTHSIDLKRSIVKPGDVLMNIVGPPLGKVSIVPATYPEWNINQAIARFSANDGISSKYLALCLRTESVLAHAISRAKATAGQFNLTLEICRELPIPVPPVAEQTEIVRRVDQLFAFADQLEAKVISAQSRINHLTQSILAKAFRGELVPQDPNDEPASVLLERIKAQRAAAPKAKRGRKASA
ncbi:restriction endonuclease subunit S [Pseudomonas frederiksbergensis]|uniref:restriction endonuclease subunit S n=1 Tax=Pseudomonas frederiksbergensis TaxID=104087 RepID=UPI002DB665EC|nr:restriction endonuclease subunit S [Pseudomonas frederiksbergensis]WRV67761.1 restriction endonuclease subunit S [Pseudomonas frederiksbergensis]